MLRGLKYRMSPKKMVIRKGFEFLTLGRVFIGVKNNSKNFLFYKMSKWTLFSKKCKKLSDFMIFCPCHG